jgi:hypothetical protein
VRLGPCKVGFGNIEIADGQTSREMPEDGGQACNPFPVEELAQRALVCRLALQRPPFAGRSFADYR